MPHGAIPMAHIRPLDLEEWSFRASPTWRMTPMGTINLIHFWHFRLITKQQNFLFVSHRATGLLSLLNWYLYFIVEHTMQTKPWFYFVMVVCKSYYLLTPLCWIQWSLWKTHPVTNLPQCNLYPCPSRRMLRSGHKPRHRKIFVQKKPS